MRHGSLFSGIGGFDLAAEWMGWENVFHCEWNEFGQKILKYYWPKAISYHDITKTNFTIHRGSIDILTGGFPCQPYSAAGKRLGKEDERHLWPEMLRAIREIQPTWVVGENVLGLVNWNGGLVFEEVQADLEAEGYEVQPYVLPAVSVNAPHRRDRVWFVAYSDRNRITKETGENQRIEGERTTTDEQRIGGQFEASGDIGSLGLSRNATDTDCIRLEQCKDGRKMAGGQEEMGGKRGEFTNAIETDGQISDATDTDNEGCQRNRTQPIAEKQIQVSSGHSNHVRANTWQNFPTQSPICSGNDGISSRLDGITFSKWRNESIKAGGNAIVPQVVFQIFKAIEEYDRLTR